MTFKEMLTREKANNLQRLEEKARTANIIAKGLHGRARRQMYEVKDRSIVQAVGLGATLTDVSLGERSVILCVRFPTEAGRQLHIPLEKTGEARGTLLRAAGGRIGPSTYAWYERAKGRKAEARPRLAGFSTIPDVDSASAKPGEAATESSGMAAETVRTGECQ